jgi:putative peptide zinc metalloprotease protein
MTKVGIIHPYLHEVQFMASCFSNARVLVEPYTHQVEAGEVVVAFPIRKIFLVLQPDAFEILEQLAKGRTLQKIEEDYVRAHGEVPDLEGFVEDLAQRGLVKSVDGSGEQLGEVMDQVDLLSQQSPTPWAILSQRAARRLFSRPVVVAQFLAISLAAVALATDPSIFPTRADLFFPDRVALMSVLILLFSFATAFVHEFAHLVAARACGVDARIRLSHRLWIVVLETDLSGLWAIPRRRRIMPLIAGPLIDVTSISILLILLRWSTFLHLGFSAQTIHYLKAAALVYILRLLWQCYLFMRTDFYYILTLATRCKNLMQDTEDLLRNKMRFLFPRWRSVDQSHIPTSEAIVIKLYVFPWLIGRLLAIYVLVAIQLPLLWSYFLVVLGRLSTGYGNDPGGFLDSLTVALLGAVSLGSGLYLWVRGIASNWRKSYAVAQ